MHLTQPFPRSSANLRHAERLEPRRFLSVTLLKGFVHIDGTDEADLVDVSADGADYRIQLNAEEHLFPRSSVRGFRINLGAGDDRALIGSGGLGEISARTTILGGAGNDELITDAGRDALFGEDGDDTLNGRGGNDALLGGEGNDHLAGYTGSDALAGGSGNDHLEGGSTEDDEHDILLGNAGDDLLIGGAGNDKLTGNVGNDTLEGNDGSDILAGGAGDDLVFGGEGRDLLFGGVGSDTFLTTERREVRDYQKGIDVLEEPLTVEW
jgi:Ca2+-binding RTX toxin-like protein